MLVQELKLQLENSNEKFESKVLDAKAEKIKIDEHNTVLEHQIKELCSRLQLEESKTSNCHNIFNTERVRMHDRIKEMNAELAATVSKCVSEKETYALQYQSLENHLQLSQKQVASLTARSSKSSEESMNRIQTLEQNLNETRKQLETETSYAADHKNAFNIQRDVIEQHFNDLKAQLVHASLNESDSQRIVEAKYSTQDQRQKLSSQLESLNAAGQRNESNTDHGVLAKRLEGVRVELALALSNADLEKEHFITQSQKFFGEFQEMKTQLSTVSESINSMHTTYAAEKQDLMKELWEARAQLATKSRTDVSDLMQLTGIAQRLENTVDSSMGSLYDRTTEAEVDFDETSDFAQEYTAAADSEIANLISKQPKVISAKMSEAYVRNLMTLSIILHYTICCNIPDKMLCFQRYLNINKLPFITEL